MNELHKTTLKDRIKNAYNAFLCKPIQQLHVGVQLTRCEECEYKLRCEECVHGRKEMNE